MLPHVLGLFTLVRQLAAGAPVTEIATSKWLVQRHGLAPMAARAGATQFREDLARSTVLWGRTAGVAEEVVERFARAKVRVAPIKGVAYAKTLYATPAERPMSDIDLLVPTASQGPASAELERMGFARVGSAWMHHASAWVRDGVVIDIHRSIVAPGRSRIDLAAIWSRTSPGWPPGAEQLDVTDAFVFHLVHLARNRLRVPLMHVVDAARLLGRMPSGDPAPAVARAATWGLEPAARIALRFCESILDDREGRPAGWLGPTHEEIALSVEPGTARKAVFDVAIAGSSAQLAARAFQWGVNRLRTRVSTR